MIFWLSSEDQNSPRGDPFQVWQMQLPLPEKWKMIRCAWVNGCRTWSGPHTSNESAWTLSDEYIGGIMIFWPSSEDQNSPRGDHFQVRQMQLPLPEKWEMIRCAWGDSCRMWSGPQTSNESASTLSDEYIGWIMIFSQSTRTHLRATLSRFDKCSSPSQKNGKWSDALESTAVGPDPTPRHPIRVHQRCQIDTLDELWYFDQPQRTRTHLGAFLSRFDKCSSPSLLQRSDWIGCNLPLFMTPGST